MISLKCNEGFSPRYMSQHSAACDLYANETVNLAPLERQLVSTGISIESIDWPRVPEGFIPELQVRARSGLAIKHGISLVNGVGTIDADYRDEIKVGLINLSRESFTVSKGMRIAQLALCLVIQIPQLERGTDRTGGFGSTGLS